MICLICAPAMINGTCQASEADARDGINCIFWLAMLYKYYSSSTGLPIRPDRGSSFQGLVTRLGWNVDESDSRHLATSRAFGHGARRVTGPAYRVGSDVRGTHPVGRSRRCRCVSDIVGSLDSRGGRSCRCTSQTQCAATETLSLSLHEWSPRCLPCRHS